MFTFSATVDELKANVDNLSSQIKSLDKEIADFNKKIGQTQGEAKTLKQALASLELRRTALLKEIDRTNLQITETQINIVKTDTKISQTEDKITQDNQSIAEILRSIKSGDQLPSPMFTALSPTGHFSDVLDSVKRDTDVSNALNSKVKDLLFAKQDLKDTKQIFEDNKQKLLNLHANLTDQKQLAEQTATEKNKLLIETKNKESTYQQLLADRKKKKDALETELLDVEAKLTAAVDVSKLPAYGKGVLKYPVDNVIITQYFGNTPFASKNPQVYNGSGHNGVDFGVKIGTPIYSSQSGIVLGTGNTDSACYGVSYGKWILIKHSNGLTTLYGHLSIIDVVVGQTVDVHQKIALSGNTGYSTGPHLHFTVYASDAVHISGPTEYKSKVCGTYLIMPLAPRAAYLNPLSYF